MANRGIRKRKNRSRKRGKKKPKQETAAGGSLTYVEASDTARGEADAVWIDELKDWPKK